MKSNVGGLAQVAGVLLLAGVMGLSACSIVDQSPRPVPTLFIIPTLRSPATAIVESGAAATATPDPGASAVPSPTSTPLVGATATLTEAELTAVALVPAVGSSLSIQYFTPTPLTVNPGGSVTLAWASEGSNQATVFRILADGSLGESWQVDTIGTITIPASSSGPEETYLLRVGDGTNIIEAQAGVEIFCNRAWFFTAGSPTGCPSSAVSSFGVEERFEHGLIYWFEEKDKIYVLYDDGEAPAWQVFDDLWQNGDPESDASIFPPGPNLYQPRRGIGLVWRSNSSVRNRLGWAVELEEQFTTDFQEEASINPNIYFINRANELLHLESGGGNWRVVITFS